MENDLVVRPVARDEVAQARQLVLAGLGEHWGWLDETKNHDLDNIPGYYGDGVFLVALLNDRLVGTGALVPEEGQTGRIVRMSVDRDYRRQGIGRQILTALILEAKQLGYQCVVLETTSTWNDAIQFYAGYGFHPVGESEGDTNFKIQLNP